MMSNRFCAGHSRRLATALALTCTILASGCGTASQGAPSQPTTPGTAASAEASTRAASGAASGATTGAAYGTLLQAAKQNPAATDYTALRLAYARSPDYNPLLGTVRRSEQLGPLIQARDDRALLARAEALLDEYWLDAGIHFIARNAATRLGDEGKATLHRAAGTGLVKSITSSGDGNSPATAFTVISTGEEYLLAILANQRVTQQGLIEVNGHKYDRLTTTDGAGATHQIYFNVDLLFAAYSRH